MKFRLATALGALVLLALVLAAAWREATPGYARFAGNTRPVRLIPSRTGEPEYCLTCHEGIEEISAAHPVEVFGCTSCHGGNGLALEAELAHAGMFGGRNPSDFSVVEASCGSADCHSGSGDEMRDHIARSMGSLQATYAGAIATVRYAFGAQPDPTARFAVHGIVDDRITTATGQPALEPLDQTLADDPQAIRTFAANCLTCHLWVEPQPGAGCQRLTGCAACHAPSNLMGTYVGEDPTVQRHESSHAARHTLTTAIPYTQCNACHNRGNYSLVDLTFHPRSDLPADRRAPRLLDYYQPIAQFVLCEWELDCVDCHTAIEAMGDGDLHSSKDEIQYVQCRTCHGTLLEPPRSRQISDPNDIALRRAFLNPVVGLEIGDTILVTDQGEPLWNIVQRPDGGYTMTGKATGVAYDLPLVIGSGCTQNVEEQESRSCHVCHAVERD